MLTLFALLGQMVMISAGNLISIYLGLELMSLALYALIALRREDKVATEAAMKYFVLGALASGFLLYGMSMVYGATGHLDLAKIAEVIASGQAKQLPLVFGVVFLVSGLAFKLGAVPFHMWLPDVYQGSPTAVTLILGAAPKLAAFAITLRLLVDGLHGLAADWQPMLMILAVLSLAIGNLTAIVQTNFKRMLAYSTISHTGFVLLGLMAGVVDGKPDAAASAYGAALFYMLTYVLTTLGTFGIILLLARQGFECEQIDDLKGLNRRNPWHAAIVLLLMFSLARHPAAGGLLRQAGGAAGAGRGRPRGAGGRRRDVLADRRLLLPARGQGRVLRRSGRPARRLGGDGRPAQHPVAQRRADPGAGHSAGRPDGAVRAGDPGVAGLMAGAGA